MDTKITLAFANDHAGYPLKMKLLEFCKAEGLNYEDFGCHSEESVDYPDFAHPMARAIEQKRFTFGISICGSGNGINMVANKYPSLRSALCWNAEIARLARAHNDANICALPGRFVETEEGIEILKAFLETPFEGGRHQRRIDKIPVSQTQ
jgi:ribose 5-phosphate isomerase B